MPAYNAAKTLERTYADIPHDLVDHMILVDDVSRDETVEIAHQLGVEVIVHRQRGRDGREDLVRGGMRRLLLRQAASRADLGRPQLPRGERFASHCPGRTARARAKCATPRSRMRCIGAGKLLDTQGAHPWTDIDEAGAHSQIACS